MQRIGKYDILHLLGQGGMGAVYKGRDTIIGRDVAIKVINERALNAPAIKKRFYREARSSGRLAHENITVIYDIGEEDNVPYLVMEYLEGQDLRELLNTGLPLTNETKLDIAVQICRGLQYAHTQGIIHRDIKPENIRILPNGRVKIMDFGIARIQNETQALTQTNLSLGTPRYMSPEQVKGENLTGQSDVFSFGVLFYELLTGQNPFVGDHVTTIIYKILNADPEPLRIEPGTLSSELQPIVSKCLTKDPEERYADFAAVLRDLQPLSFRHQQTVSLATDETVALNTTDALTQPMLRPRVKTQPTPVQDRLTVPPAADPAPSTPQPTSSRKGRWAALGLVLALCLTGTALFIFSPWSNNDAEPPAQEPVAADESGATTGENGTEPTEAIPTDTPSDAATLPALPNPATGEARTAADRERTAMNQARQPIEHRREEPEVAALYQRADEARREGATHYDAGNFAEARRVFQAARGQFEAIGQRLADKDQAQAAASATENQTATPAATETDPVEQPVRTETPPVVEMPPANDEKKIAADRARTTMQAAKNRVASSQQQTAPFQQALSLEAEGNQAYDTRTFDRAAERFSEARTRFDEAAATVQPEAEAAGAIQALAQRLKTSIEQKQTDTMLTVFFSDWSEFFKVASNIQATSRTSNMQVTGTQATVDVRLELSYRDNRNQQQQAVASYSWVLEYKNATWVIIRAPSK